MRWSTSNCIRLGFRGLGGRLGTVDGFCFGCRFGFVGWVVFAVVGVEVQAEESGPQGLQVFMNAPSWMLLQAAQPAFPTMLKAARLLCLFFSAWQQILVCVWDSVFCVQNFRLGLDYAYHVGGTGKVGGQSSGWCLAR